MQVWQKGMPVLYLICITCWTTLAWFFTRKTQWGTHWEMYVRSSMIINVFMQAHIFYIDTNVATGQLRQRSDVLFQRLIWDFSIHLNSRNAYSCIIVQSYIHFKNISDLANYPLRRTAYACIFWSFWKKYIKSICLLKCYSLLGCMRFDCFN